MTTRTVHRACWAALCALLLCAALPLVASAQTVQLAKTSQGGLGTFNYTMTNLSGGADSITTVTAGTPQASATVFTFTDAAQPITVAEAVNPQFTLDAASCVDTSGAVTGTFGTLSGATLTIPGGTLQPTSTVVCTFVNTQRQPDLSVTKQVTPNAVASGGTVTFTLTASNVGVVDVANAVLADAPGTGLSCTSAGSCTASGGASCPASIPASALFGGGVAIPALPVGGSVAVTAACTVTASGN
jgi:uncharacterized repeat protein (TIGR01451 family)